jgi:hypothetical protein
LYLNEWADEAVVANRASVKIDRLNDDDVCAKLNLDNSGAPDLGATENPLPRSRRLAHVLL